MMTPCLCAKVAISALFIFVSLPLLGQTAADYIKQGDEYFVKFEDAQALQEYLKAAKAEPANYEALWKTSRAYYDIGGLMPLTDSKAADEQRKIYIDSMRYARQAIKADPNGTWGHLFLSAAWGKYVLTHLLTQSKKEQVNASKQIKVEIDKAIELDPKNDLAYHALGRWHRQMAEIGGAQRFFGGLLYGSIPRGTYRESEKYLKKAIELNPNYTLHYLELGRTYLDMKKPDLAAQEFEKVLQAPITTSRCEMNKEEAQAELDLLKKKEK
jgi:tetratricopeptide (TPR) repeat protein